ncbi:class I SAM-dependent methyltransferase [Methanocella sp. CWC-04]|uniref:Class I SAM-dependent methyltransferase n=1 Tax=Methanooceanicella nereidis TaxID=2052831 RepID=A0AAP2RBF4_9EURY|nr:class I SAM-dependent methyltransferase [Methanocella sp. CWC-04]MCD1293540.1 class I SAM-dependent methyltransferase [Methanocella sp. CWC-04]
MKQSDRITLHEYYDSKLKTYGYDTRSLGWIPGARNVRLGALTSIGDLDNSSVLDVGCGFGDLYGYMVKKGMTVSYTGVDINPDFIEIAKQVYPDARFMAADFEEEDIGGNFDWIFAAGIFTIKISDNEAFIRNMLKKMFDVCDKGFAADFLSPIGYGTEDKYWRCEPESILAFCRKLSRRVTLRCDYMAGEFCVYVYKNDITDERNVFEGYDER